MPVAFGHATTVHAAIEHHKSHHSSTGHGHHHGHPHVQHHDHSGSHTATRNSPSPRSRMLGDQHDHAEHPGSPTEHSDRLFRYVASMNIKKPMTRSKSLSYREQVDAFAPFSQHIKQNAHFQRTQSHVGGIEIRRKELTDEEIADIGAQNGVDVADVRQCWECFKVCDSKGLGYLDSDQIKLLLAILEQLQLNEALNTLQDRGSVLRFPDFAATFCKGSGGRALLFRMATLRQEINSVHKMMTEAEVTSIEHERSWGLFQKMLGTSDNSLKTKRKELHEYALDHVPEVHVHDYLKRELDNTEAYKQLPYAMGLFATFVVAMHLHTLSWKIFTVELSITSDIQENANFAFSGTLPLENGRMGHKTIYDVNSVPDFWSWLSAGLVPLMWIEGWDVSEVWSNTLARCSRVTDLLGGYGWNSSRSAAKNAAYSKTVPANKTAFGGPAYSADCPAKQTRGLPVEFYGLQKHGRGMYLYFNRVIGGLRLRQERQRPSACRSEAYRETSGSFGAPCYRGLYFSRPDQRSLIYMDDERVDMSRTTYLRTGKTQAHIRQEIRLLESKRWIDQSVQKIELAFPSLNAELGTLTVCFIVFHLPRSGHILKSLEPQSVFLRPYNGWWNYVLDSVWVLMTLKLLLKEVQLVWSTTHKLGAWQGLSRYATFWNVVDLFSICMGFAIMGLWIRFLVMLQDMEALLLTGQNAVNGNWETDAELGYFFDQVTNILKYKVLLQRTFAGYVVVCVLRFFKAFNAQPRLAVVTRTLSSAGVDILHFGISFLTGLFTSAASGLMVFGQHLEEFKTIDRACITCYRLLLGDFDFQTLWEHGSYEATLWFWANTILLMLIMLNMLLAIIMDVYTEVHESALDESDMTLFSQAQQVMVRWWQRRKGKEVHLGEVLDALVDRREWLADGDGDGEDLKPARTIGPSGLKMLVPRLEDKQAVEIMEGANLLFDKASGCIDDLSVEDTIIRMGDMMGRQSFSLQCLTQMLEAMAMIGQDLKIQTGLLEEKRLPDGEKILDAVLEKISPDQVSAAVEQAFAKRLDPLFEDLVKVNDDISACIGELGRDFERRFGALERHAEHICRELEHLQNGRSSSEIYHASMAYAASPSWILRDDRPLQSTPSSTPCAQTPSRFAQRLLDSPRREFTAPT